MKTIDLLAPLLDNGIRNINFFNGRLLSAEDLSAEQDAGRRRLAQLGRVIGEGVAYGLEVTLSDKMSSEKKAPLLTVKAGLAVNRSGRAVSLNEDTTIALIQEEETPPATPGSFGDCRPPTTAVYQAGTGIFVLLMTPAMDFEGSAPMSGLGNITGAARGCGRRYAIEGVQFRLAEMNLNNGGGADWLSDETRTEVLSLMEKTDAASLSRLRNILVHLCFGTEQLRGFAADPFARSTERDSTLLAYGAIDAMRKKKADKDPSLPAAYYKNYITECDIPLALICWTRDGVQFVDMWSVRRRVVARNKSLAWSLAVDDRGQAEGEAMFLQFQEQLAEVADIRNTQSVLGAIIATDYFRYLPAAGILPVTASYIQAYQQESGAKPVQTLKTSTGLYPPKFFQGLTVRKPAFIEGARINPLLNTARHYPALDLTSKELIWIYLIRENVEAIANQPLSPPQAYLIFTSAQVPCLGNARFDISKWSYSSYAFV